jgi:7,8-dihydropterin-6-yl-methyl-4-(beta-D-ribofuranosyl)aminobenzene 5'-phosphate synthase
VLRGVRGKTVQGLAVILGCAHRGIINTLYYAQQLSGTAEMHTILRGSHLLRAPQERFRQTIAVLRELGVQRLGLCHCTDLPAASMLALEFREKFFFNKGGTIVHLP